MNKSWPLIFISFASGIGLAYYKVWPAWLLIAILLLLAASLYRDYRPRILLVILVIFGGAAYYNLLTLDLPGELPTEKAVQYAGCVKDFPYFDGQKTTFTLQPEKPSTYQKNIRVVCLFQARISRGD